MTQPEKRSAVAAHDTSPAGLPVPTGDLFEDLSHPQVNLSPGVTTRHGWFSMRRPILWILLAIVIPLAGTTFVLLTAGGSDSQAHPRGGSSQVARGEVTSPRPATARQDVVQHRDSAIRRTSPHTP
jgi:hypothetical protein